MIKLKKFSKKLIKSNKGQGMVEYILLLVVVVGLVFAFKGKIKAAFDQRVGAVEDGMSNFTVDQ